MLSKREEERERKKNSKQLVSDAHLTALVKSVTIIVAHTIVRCRMNARGDGRRNGRKHFGISLVRMNEMQMLRQERMRLPLLIHAAAHHRLRRTKRKRIHLTTLVVMMMMIIPIDLDLFTLLKHMVLLSSPITRTR